MKRIKLMKNTLTALMAAASLVALTSGANAFEYNPYVGLSYNYNDVNSKGLGGAYSPDFNSGTVSLGTSFNKYFGTELFYQLSDNYAKSYTGVKLGSRFQAYGLDLYGYLPLGCDQVFSLLGTAGVAEYQFKHKGLVDGWDRTTAKDKGIGWRAGLGAQYSINDNWDVRAVARYVNFNQLDHMDHMMEYTAGIKYNF